MFFENNYIFQIDPLWGWTQQKKKFCPTCDSTYDTIEEAFWACEQIQDCKVVYDLFCDGEGYFCICPINTVVQQTHPRGLDCLYTKDK